MGRVIGIRVRKDQLPVQIRQIRLSEPVVLVHIIEFICRHRIAVAVACSPPIGPHGGGKLCSLFPFPIDCHIAIDLCRIRACCSTILDLRIGGIRRGHIEIGRQPGSHQRHGIQCFPVALIHPRKLCQIGAARSQRTFCNRLSLTDRQRQKRSIRFFRSTVLIRCNG